MLSKEKYESPVISVEKYNAVDVLTASNGENQGGLEYGDTSSTFD